MQNQKIFDKSFKTRIKIYKYKNIKLTYQGTYELDFIKNFIDKINILNGYRINYISKNGINRVYYSDFYIPSLNLIVEIKSSYTASLDDDLLEKKLATITNGYNYILIMNKNYQEFINLIDINLIENKNK